MSDRPTDYTPRIDEQLAQSDKQVRQLQAANTREVERRREAEATINQLLIIFDIIADVAKKECGPETQATINRALEMIDHLDPSLGDKPIPVLECLRFISNVKFDDVSRYGELQSRIGELRTELGDAERLLSQFGELVRDQLTGKVVGVVKQPCTPILKVKRLPHAEGLPLPSYATDGSACLDLYSAEEADRVVLEGMSWRFKTGICVEIPPGYKGRIVSRSSWLSGPLQVQHGTIDSDYRGELIVVVRNLVDRSGKSETKNCMVKRGWRIAQLEIAPVARVEVQEVEELSETERGDGGFGSTGR